MTSRLGTTETTDQVHLEGTVPFGIVRPFGWPFSWMDELMIVITRLQGFSCPYRNCNFQV